MENTTSIEPIAYFIPEFCRKFVISKSSFYRELNAGRLNVYKRGKRTMIERVEAERWHSNLTHQSSPNNVSKNGSAQGGTATH